MSFKVIIIQPDSKPSQFLINLLKERGDEVWPVTQPAEIKPLLKQVRPELIVVDLHLLVSNWEDSLAFARRRDPQLRLLFTVDYPDPPLESKVQEQYGAIPLLRTPFTRTDLETALRALATAPAPAAASRPRVRMPMRFKITLPYMILALLVATVGAYLVSQVVLDTIEERFTNQLIEAGKLTNDWMVREEDRLLETLRLLAYVETMPEAVAAADADQLLRLALPLAVNSQEDAIEILDTRGTSLLSLRHTPAGNVEDYTASRGEAIYSQWPFVQKVLERQVTNNRDKFGGLARAPWGDYLYIAGPIVDEQGNWLGVILVGKSLPNLVRQIRADTLAHVTIYDFNGRHLASTLILPEARSAAFTPELVDDILARRDSATMIRPLALASIDYSEIIGPWQVRRFVGSQEPGADNVVGLLGAALPEAFLVNPSQVTRIQIFSMTTLAFLAVIILGLYLANRITRPLLQVVEASTKVAQGNLDVQVRSTGNDEIAVLAYSFNQMVTDLREGSLYRDLLGRTVSPEVREQLRRSFAEGDLRLEGQEALATVLITDIQGFTTLSEAKDSTTILNWLNEYFGEVVPVITRYGGVVSKFEGDSVLAFFGILPRPLPTQESAYQACRAAMDILEAVKQLNQRRVNRGEAPFIVGIGINTGPVTAGALGTTDRLHYTIIGDTVNTTSRLEGITRQLGQVNATIISQHTLFALRDRRHKFRLVPMGTHTVKGKVEQLLVYQLQPAEETYEQVDGDIRSRAKS